VPKTSFILAYVQEAGTCPRHGPCTTLSPSQASGNSHDGSAAPRGVTPGLSLVFRCESPAEQADLSPSILLPSLFRRQVGKEGHGRVSRFEH